jgi:TonB-linked SusC/RagA family outer membrane protein
MKRPLTYPYLQSDRHVSGKLSAFVKLTMFLFLFSAFIYGPESAYAALGEQARKVSGTVTDQAGTQLPGVSVYIKGTQVGVVTGMDGKYSLEVPGNNATLVFSFIGMGTQEVPVGAKAIIDIVLLEEAMGLDEVVVVGYGVQKKVNLTGSITTIKAEELTEIAMPTLAQTIMGRSPGLFIKNVSGQPGKNNNVSYNIRGFGTPLIIIDGMPATTEEFNLLDPNDIEDFSILKDAAAAAIYGSRAGEGVILVKTKRGKIGTEVTITNNTSVQFFTLVPDFVDSYTYASLENVANFNEQKPAIWTNEQLQKFKDGSDPAYPNTDWWGITMRKYAPQVQNNINLQGGTDKVKFFVSAGYFYQEAMLKANDTKVNKYTLRSNLDVAITDKLNMGIDFNVLNKLYDGPVAELERGTIVGIMTDMFRARPYFAAHWPDETKLIGYQTPLQRSFAENVGYKKQNTLTGDAKISIDYKLPFNITAKGIFQLVRKFDRYTEKQKSTPMYLYDYVTDVYTVSGYTFPYTSLYESMDISNSFNQQYFLTWDKQIGDHSLSALAVYEILSDDRNYVNAQRLRYDFDIDYLFAGPDLDKTNGGSAGKFGRKGIITRFNYNYKGKYLVELNSRYDASPRFPKETRWGFFPSVSLGWRLSKEAFITDNLPIISNLKLRGSFGLLGNDNIDNNTNITTYNYYYLETFSMTSQFIFDGATNALSKGIRPDALPNKLITWEKMSTTNVGFDFGLWNDKIAGSFDYFYRLRTDVLGTRIQSIPNVVGASMPQVNYAEYDNRGFEFDLNYRETFGQFDVSAGGNIAWNREKTKLVDQNVYATQEAYRTGNRINEWTDRFWGLQSAGLFTSDEEIAGWVDQDGKNNSTLSPGDIKYVDYNNDGRISNEDYVLIGRGVFPRINYGFNTSVEWKGISLSMLWQGAGLFDFNLLNSPDFTLPFYAGNQPIVNWAENAYIPENPWVPSRTDAKWPLFRTDNGNRGHSNTKTSDFWLVNGDYLRLKSLELGYSLPKAVIQKLRLKSCKIFVSGYNLFTFSEIDFLDPEANTSPGRTFGDYYPPTGTYNAGFVIKF